MTALATPSSDITLTAEQSRAVDSVAMWLRDRSKPYYILQGPAGVGKAQPLNAIIQTPYGPRRMGDLVVGDEVLGGDGKATLVTGVFPQGVKPVYRVTFRDGYSTECCEEHLWRVSAGTKIHKRKSSLVRSTKRMMDEGLTYPDKRLGRGVFGKFKIPLCPPVEYKTPSPRVDPYTIGALIGDGYCVGTSVILCCNDMEIVERVRNALPSGMRIVTTTGSCLRHTIKDFEDVHWNRLKQHLESMNLTVYSHTKRIPGEYLYAPTEDRIALLQGLMDTDGSIGEANRVSFSTGSAGLADDVAALVQSLGGIVVKREYRRRDKKSAEFQLNVKLNLNPFYLPRKANRWSPPKKNPPSRYLISIEPCGKIEQQCISVAAVDGLYLTDNFIVTHNTFLAKHFAAQQSGQVLFAAYTGKAASVLASKGCTPASTLHALLYTTSKERDDELASIHAELVSVPDNSPAARRLTKRIVDLQSPKFVLKTNSPLRNAKLLICDELGMVDAALAADILSFNVPLLVLGDPYQLPPIDGKGFFNDNPDFLLTEIHRQAAESPVIHLATRAREGLPLRRGHYGTSSVISRSEVTKDIALGVSQIICGSNKARVQLNLENRQLRGFSGIFSQSGERLICLRNNPREGLMNGQILETITDAEDYSDTLIRLRFAEFDQPIKCHKLCFSAPEKQAVLPYQKRAQANEFTWGAAITGHKSQGSQWPSVLVYADQFKWRPELYRQWLYTAITRAEESAVVAL